MYKQILVPIDLGSPELNKPAMETAMMMAGLSQGTIRLVNVLPMTPVMLAEYVPPDFEVQQRKASEEALADHREGNRSRPVAHLGDGAAGRHLPGDSRRGEQLQGRPHRDDVAPAAPARGAHLLPRLQCGPRGALRQLLGAGGEELNASVTAAGRASQARRPAGNGRAGCDRRSAALPGEQREEKADERGRRPFAEQQRADGDDNNRHRGRRQERRKSRPIQQRRRAGLEARRWCPAAIMRRCSSRTKAP